MPNSPEQQHAPPPVQEKAAHMNLRTNPMGTVEAIARIEGPAWLAHQQELSEEVSRIEPATRQDIERVAHESVVGAMEKLASRDMPENHPRKIYTINGRVGHRYYVFSDGSVRFSARHESEQDTPERGEYLAMVRQLGFEIHEEQS